MIIMSNENIVELENKLTPKGTVSVIGCGRLGIRVIMDLIEVHRGGAHQIFVYDGANFALFSPIFAPYFLWIISFLAIFAPSYTNIW